MGTRPESLRTQALGERWQRAARNLARPLAWAVRIALGIPVLWLMYTVCPGSAKGRIVGEWDSLTHDGMRDVVTPMKYWKLHRLPDGTGVALEWGSWIRYNEQSETLLHEVHVEGAATFGVSGSTSLRVDTGWGTIRTGVRPAIVRVEFVPRGRCSLTTYSGEVAAISKSGRAVRVPEGSWLDCSGGQNSRILLGAAPATIP